MSETELKELISMCRTLKGEVGTKTKNLNNLKSELRTFLIDSGIKKCEGVEIRRSFSSFDIELLRLERFELFERYCTREEQKTITFKNSISKKMLTLLRDEHPELWNDQDYRKEGTARLYGL